MFIINYITRRGYMHRAISDQKIAEKFLASLRRRKISARVKDGKGNVIGAVYNSPEGWNWFIEIDPLKADSLFAK